MKTKRRVLDTPVTCEPGRGWVSYVADGAFAIGHMASLPQTTTVGYTKSSRISRKTRKIAFLQNASLASISGNKTSRKELSIFDKGQISGLSRADLTLTQIHRNLNIPPSTIRSVLERLDTQPTEVNKLRSERPHVITLRAARLLVRHVRLTPKITWRELKQITDLDFDKRTLRVTLEAHGISHWLALKRPLLTSEVAKLRLKWAQNHKD